MKSIPISETIRLSTQKHSDRSRRSIKHYISESKTKGFTIVAM